MSARVIVGDALERLRELPDESVQCCVTSPPYWGLRDYGVAGQLGLERTPEEYVAKMVAVFREVRRVLAKDGVLWLNVGDSYATGGGAVGRCPGGGEQGARFLRQGHINTQPNRMPLPGLKPKDLIGVPWMLAFALRSDGWWLRSDIIWAKPNGMPESVQDRPTRSHEMVFLLTKSERYFYDIDAARTPAQPAAETRLAQDVERQQGSERANGGGKTNGTMKAVRRSDKQRGHSRTHSGFNARWDTMEKDEQQAEGSNLRSVWWLAPAQYKEGHYAVMPSALAEICIRSGSRLGDTVLDPFGGAGTTGLVSDRLGRNAILIELNPEYATMAERRIHDDAPLFAVTSSPERQPE